MAKGSQVARRRCDGAKREANCDGLNDSEIGQVLGISRARVFQIRQRALEKIRIAVLADPDLAEVVAELRGSDHE